MLQANLIPCRWRPSTQPWALWSKPCPRDMAGRPVKAHGKLDSMQVAAINTAMGSLVKTCTTFPAERSIVTRERSKKGYDVGPYFLAKLLAELPVGALFPGAFGLLVYPTTGLHRRWSRQAQYLHLAVTPACLAVPWSNLPTKLCLMGPGIWLAGGLSIGLCYRGSKQVSIMGLQQVPSVQPCLGVPPWYGKAYHLTHHFAPVPSCAR